MKLLGAYKNGNYATMIFDDGTKVRKTDDNVFYSRSCRKHGYKNYKLL